MDITKILNTSKYKKTGNIYSFINEERPEWSKRLDLYFRNSKYPMGRMYNYSKIRFKDNRVMQEFYKEVLETNGIIIDLASGPSGYFGPVVDNLGENSTFVITDASEFLIHAHSVANRKRDNVKIFDIDLEKSLPLRDESIDCYCGYVPSNVDKFDLLLNEISRTLKKNGKLCIIDWFFDEKTETYKYLKENNKVTYSLDYFTTFCNRLGLKLTCKDLDRKYIGKLEGDLLPINPFDEIMVYSLFFIKQ